MTLPLLDRDNERSRARWEAAPEETAALPTPRRDLGERQPLPDVSAPPVAAAPAAPAVTSFPLFRDVTVERRRTVARINQFLWFLVGVGEALLALRFALKLLGANPSAAFTQFVYGITGALVAPFEGIFPTQAAGAFEWEPATLVAMLVYFLLALGVARLVWIIYNEPREVA